MEEINEAVVAKILAHALTETLTIDDFKEAVSQPLITDITPWALWVLVAFLRHERRQKWVGYIVESKLGGSGHELGSWGAAGGHPEGIGQEGEVPDNPGWRYYFHGCGCCLTHADGTSIDVDFGENGETGEIDAFFYSAFLSSAARLDWTDGQLKHPGPLEHAWQWEIEGLASSGLIKKEHRIQLTERGRQLGERLEPLVDELNKLAAHDYPKERLTMSWLLTMLGDFVSAAKIAATVSPEISKLLAGQAKLQVSARVKLLASAKGLDDQHKRRLQLTALAVLGRSHVEEEVMRALKSRPASSIHFLAVELIDSWKDEKCELVLFETLERLSPTVGLIRSLFGKTVLEPDEIVRPRNGVVIAISKVLLNRNTPTTLQPERKQPLRRVLTEDRGACDSEAGFFLYLLGSPEGLVKLKKNLGNRVPITRSEAAIFLSMIGTEDAIRALVDAANGPPEKGGHEAACILSMMDDPRARTASVEWNRRHDGYEEAEGSEIEIHGRKLKTWSMDEMMRANMKSSLQYAMDRIHRDYGQMLANWRI